MKRKGFTPLEKVADGIKPPSAQAVNPVRKFFSIRIRVRGSLTGFTLIEMMLVVVIIAALASMIIPRLAGRSEQAKTTRAKADVNANIALALKLYELDNGNYPSTEQGLGALLSKPSSNPVPGNWNGPYLERNPIDPWGRTYQYKYPGSISKAGYDLYSLGKDGQESGDDVTNWQD